MDFRDISKMRVTVRKFDRRPVEKEKVDLILEAGRWSPTAVDYQPQRILVLNSPESLDKVRQFCTFGYDRKYAELAEECDAGDQQHNVYYYGAPLVFLVCWDKTVCWTHPQNGQSSGSTDATIVTTHMMLEAASLGLGTVWISYFDHGKARELLQIPENYEINGMLYVGYPADDFKPNPKMSGKRFPIEHTCFDNGFDRPYRTDFHEEAAAVSFERKPEKPQLTREYLSFVSDVIHNSIVAVTDEAGHPFTAAIDIMMSDENSLYFLTAKGKRLYQRLTRDPSLALTAMKGSDTMHTVAISIQGKARELGSAPLPVLFKKNPYMYDIYPTDASRTALTVFQIYEGNGEWFSISGRTIERDSFAFGGAEAQQEEYRIEAACTGCGACLEVCPRNCIASAEIPFVIDKRHCISCGNCSQQCPVGAIRKIR